jgi:hypothetical protein
VTAEASPRARFKRAIERRALWLAEDAMREMGSVTLDEAHDLVNLYAERGSPKFERAALRWLARYLAEGAPTLQQIGRTASGLAELEVDRGVTGERIGALPGIREWAAAEEEEWHEGGE